MSETPIMSIITVASNDSVRLAASLESFLNLPSNCEHVTVIPRSDLTSLNVWRAFKSNRKKFTAIFYDTGQGVYEAMNLGASKATGDYLMYWNAGESLRSGHELLKFCAELEGLSPVWAICQIERESPSPKVDAQTTRNFQRNNASGFISHQAIAVKRQTFTSLGGFSMKYRVAADTNFILKLIKEFMPLISSTTPVYVEMASLSSLRHRRARYEVLRIYLQLSNLKYLPFAIINIFVKELSYALRKLSRILPK
jgi:hypothetical protein